MVLNLQAVYFEMEINFRRWGGKTLDFFNEIMNFQHFRRKKIGNPLIVIDDVGVFENLSKLVREICAT